MGTDRKNIVLTSNTGWYLFNFRSNLIKHLEEQGYVIHLIAPQDQYLIKLGNQGYSIHTVNIDNKGQNVAKDIVTCIKYAQLFRQIRPIAILSFTIKPIIYAGFVASLLKIPAINTVTGLGTAFIAGGVLQKWVIFLYRLSQKNASAVVFQNNEDYKVFVENKICDSARRLIIPGSGINLSVFGCSPPNLDKVKVILFIGRFLSDKGVREFVEAAKILNSRANEKVLFQMLGSSVANNRTSISNAELAKWDRLEFLEILGWIEDVRPVIVRAHCVVLPSYREGLPRALIEAGALGRPVVASAVPGCRDVVVDGKTGYLCSPRSAEDLAQKIEAIISLDRDDWLQMSHAARKRAEACFDERIVLEKYDRLVREVTS